MVEVSFLSVDELVLLELCEATSTLHNVQEQTFM